MDAAREAGLAEMGFSDHIPMPQGYDPEHRMTDEQFPDYVAGVEKVRERFPGMSIRLGIEADYFPGFEEAVRKRLISAPFDYVLGSVHFMGDWGFDQPSQAGQWRLERPFGAWETYFSLLADAASSGLFDVLAHFDLVKVMDVRLSPEKEVAAAEPALKAAARHGVAIEVNTAGLYKPCREIYPSEPILRRARELGIGVTLGSDAHRPEDVAAGFDEAAALLRKVGYKTCLLFEKRKAREVPLEI